MGIGAWVLAAQDEGARQYHLQLGLLPFLSAWAQSQHARFENELTHAFALIHSSGKILPESGVSAGT